MVFPITTSQTKECANRVRKLNILLLDYYYSLNIRWNKEWLITAARRSCGIIIWSSWNDSIDHNATFNSNWIGIYEHGHSYCGVDIVICIRSKGISITTAWKELLWRMTDHQMKIYTALPPLTFLPLISFKSIGIISSTRCDLNESTSSVKYRHENELLDKPIIRSSGISLTAVIPLTVFSWFDCNN